MNELYITPDPPRKQNKKHFCVARLGARPQNAQGQGLRLLRQAALADLDVGHGVPQDLDAFLLLSTNQSWEPTGKFRKQIQAMAVKRGLMFAYRRV